MLYYIIYVYIYIYIYIYLYALTHLRMCMIVSEEHSKNPDLRPCQIVNCVYIWMHAHVHAHMHVYIDFTENTVLWGQVPEVSSKDDL
jgi:hypothetical protein